MPAYIKTSSTWRSASQIWVKLSSTWRSVSQGWINVAGTWRQFFGSDNTYTFSFGNTVHIGTNGYISLDGGQSAISISSTVDRVLGILPADLELNSIRYAADSSKFYVFFRGKRLGGTNFEIEYEVHFTNGQDYALIKLVAFPSSTYSLTGYYVDGSSSGYSRITATRTVGAEYRVYFGTTSAFATSFTEYGTSTHPVWLVQSTLTSGTADDGYITVVGNQGSSPQAPSSVTASSITGTTATISWSAITNANAGMSAIQSYDYSINGGGSWTSTGTSTSVNLTGLTGGTSYTVLVRANNYFFTGTNYGSVTFSTTSVLTPPSIFLVIAGNSNSQPVSVYFSGGSGPFYQMWWQSGSSTPPSSVPPDAFGSSSPLTDSTGPSSAGTYYAFVRSVAVNDGSTVPVGGTVPSTTFSEWSTGFAFTVTAAPPTITNVTASSITTATATISWSSTNQATYSIAGLPGSPLTGTTATSRAVTGLSPSTNYTATVTVANSDGATASGNVNFTTTALPNISSITMTPSGSSTGIKMTATWSATNTASVFFMVYRSSSSAVNSPVDTFVTSGTTNGSTITTSQPTTGINFYYQFYLTPYSGSSGTGSAGTQRVTGVKRNTVSGGPTTYTY